MKLVIDIPRDVYDKILEIYKYDKELHRRPNLYKAVAKGKIYERPKKPIFFKERRGKE